MKYTQNAQRALTYAEKFAKQKQQNYVGTEHLLEGLVRERDGVAGQILAENGVTLTRLIEFLDQLMVQGGKVALLDKEGYSPRLRRVLSIAEQQAERYGSVEIGTEHLMLGLILEGENVAIKLMESLSVIPAKIYFEVLAALGEDPGLHKEDLSPAMKNPQGQQGPQQGGSMLAQFSRDMTRLAAQGKLEPMIGREDEILRVVRILSRRTKNNPCLVGEPGVGKTAIVEGLAAKIARGDVPESVRGKRILSLDLAAMIAGSKYRGEFEERMKNLIAEVTAAGDVVLFLDEIHTLIGAGGAEGAIDASSILKPSLARGEIQLIGATTIAEYRKYVEKDAALERRFQPVTVEEPTPAQAEEILRGVVHKYEEHHGVTVSEDAIKAAVELSVRYINDRNLPDKAIDVLDEASAAVRLRKHSKGKTDDTLMKLAEEIDRADREMAEAVKRGDIAAARELRQQQNALVKKHQQKTARLEHKKNSSKEVMPAVTAEDVADVISLWSKVPVTQLTIKETERLMKLEKTLHARVIGQESAVKAVASAIRRGRVGLQDPNRPIGSFLFLGPTGVGKTELSKALAEAMFGSEKDMIRVDMSEYMEQYAVSKMIGSAPGYVGYEEGGQLAEQVRRHPYSVILFDEIEKAHHDVFNILLQILDDGRITDSKGRTINFKNTIIIMTSNVGAQRIVDQKTLGFGGAPSKEQSYEKMKSSVMEEVKKIFKPEFINRIDEIQVFRQLDKEEMLDITGLLCENLRKRAKEQMNLQLRMTPAFREYIVDKYSDSKMGARPLKRALQQEVEDPLADLILSGQVAEGGTVTVRIHGGKVSFN